MNTEQFRESLKAQWLDYYRANRGWVSRLGVWVNCEGQRRPSSSFILASLSILEPQLNQMLPLIVDLSSNPDRIVMALGLNINPDEALKALDGAKDNSPDVKLLPGEIVLDVPLAPSLASVDEACSGSGKPPKPNRLSYERRD